MSEPTTTPTPNAVAQVPADQMAALAELFGDMGKGQYCSMPPTDPRYAALLYKLEEEADAKMGESIGETIRIEHVYAHRVELTSAEAEVVEAIRTCVVTTEGKVYSCVSDGVRKSIFRLMRAHGLPPWKLGVPVQIKQRRLGNGRLWMSLADVVAEKAEGRKAKS